MSQLHDIYDINFKLKVPLGYQVQITTWENDGNYHGVKTISGLTEEDVIFYLDIANLFTSKNNRKKGGGMGNTENHPSYLLEVIKEILQQNPDISVQTKEIWEKGDEDTIYELLVENVLGETVDYEDTKFFCRVFESFKVFEIREPIVDLTQQFK